MCVEKMFFKKNSYCNVSSFSIFAMGEKPYIMVKPSKKF